MAKERRASIVSDVATGLLSCAYKGLVGLMKYHGDENIVIPFECGTTSRGNEVLYCQFLGKRMGKHRYDVSDMNKTRMYLLDDISTFVPTDTEARPRFKIKKNRLLKKFKPYLKGDDQAEFDDRAQATRRTKRENRNMEKAERGDERKKAAGMFDRRRVLRIAQKIMEFSGAEANLFDPDKTPDSYRVVGDDGRSASAVRADRVRGDNLLYCGEYYSDAACREIARGIKAGDPRAIREAARQMAAKVPPGAVLVPVPGRTGRATTALDLAKAIAGITGSEVVDALRGVPRESLYEMKKRGDAIDVDMLGFTLDVELPEGRPVVFVDNVVATGTTGDAALGLVRSGSILAFAFDPDAFRRSGRNCN